MTMDKTKEALIADLLENIINDTCFNPKRFAELTTRWHRFIQNELFKLAVWIIRVYGSDEYRYDLRNEFAATKAKEIVKSGILD